MSTLIRPAVALMGIVIVAAAFLAVSGRTAPSDRAAPTDGPIVSVTTMTTVTTVRTTTAATEAAVHLCDLLAFAASADPSLQYAAGRSSADLDAVASIQRDVLIAAAELLGPGEAAEALLVLANSFVPTAGTSLGDWSEAAWADAVINRSDPGVLGVLADLGERCDR